MTKRKESREGRERGLKRVRRSDKQWTEVSRGTGLGQAFRALQAAEQGRDRDVEGRVAVPDVAKRNPEQPGPAKRASPTASERLRYRSLSTELRPWLKTLQGLAQGSDQGLALQALQVSVSLSGLLLALDMAGRTG